MGQVLKARIPADPGTRFAPGSVDSWVGKPVRNTDKPTIITAAVVIENGAAVEITMESTDA